jgi:hypothetical protein
MRPFSKDIESFGPSALEFLKPAGDRLYAEENRYLFHSGIMDINRKVQVMEPGGPI